MSLHKNLCGCIEPIFLSLLAKLVADSSVKCLFCFSSSDSATDIKIRAVMFVVSASQMSRQPADFWVRPKR